MSIRISSLQYMYNYKVALNRAYQKQTKLFESADGSSIHRGSDDPIAYSKLLRYNVSKVENEQYHKDVNNAVAFMNTADATLTNMADLSKTIATKTIQAANTYNTSADFESIAKEMFSSLEEIVSLCNTQQGDRYLFSGQRDIIEPFTISDETYQRGVAKTLDAAQTRFFKNHPSEGDSYVYQMLELTDEDGNEYCLDNETGYIYTKKFLEEDFKEVRTLGYTSIYDAQSADSTDAYYSSLQKLLTAGTAGQVNVTDTSVSDFFQVSDYFDSRGIIQMTDDATPVPKTLTVSISTTDANGNTTTETKDLSFNTIGQRIVTYNGDTSGISMVKKNGASDLMSDIVSITGTDIFHTDIFDNENSGNDPSGVAYMNNMIQVYNKVLAEDVDWLTGDGVGLSNAAHNSISLSQTTIGARLQLYTSVETMLDKQDDYITEDITKVSSVDVAELATRLMEMTALYNMSLSIGGRILPVSLADYL
ncbi:MAG: hypothetical protein IJT06_06330 [Selenomonadaceae bacterium]|nr:hypothetical protein [Selenomonadaceae bacterium]